MKAIGFYNTGGPEVLQEVEAADPVPAANEVVIRTSNTSINNLDILMRSGATKINLKMPHITGTDIVGKIEKAGGGVSDLAAGDRVVASTVYGCGECFQCRSGSEVLCREWKVPGLHAWGSYGELVKLPASIVMPAPKGFSDEELGCMPLCLSVGWRSLHSEAKAQEGESVVVRGASGNVGIFSVMLAKALKLKVIAFTRSPTKKHSLGLLGADHVFDYDGNEKRAAEQVYEVTDGKGADIVMDPLGSTLNDSIAMLRPGGRVVIFGTMVGPESNISIKGLYWKSASIFGVHNASRVELEEAFGFAASNNVKPIIAQRMGIREAPAAHRLFQQSATFGKILLQHRW